jgi:glutathione S-transferase
VAAGGSVEAAKAPAPLAVPHADELPTLWQITFSHFNEKARWALDYKGIPHRRRSVLPGLHALRARRLYGGMTFPVLSLDGQVIPGSDRIIDAVERHRPDPSLYPEHQVDRDLALELQEFFDSELGPHLRRYLFFWLLPETGEASAFMSQGFGAPARAAYRVTFPLTRIAMRKAMRIDAEGAELGRLKTLAALDRIEAELGPSGYLVADRFSLADLAAAALMFPIVRPQGFQYEAPDPWPGPIEEFRASIADRVGFKWVEDMWRKHRGSSKEAKA